MLIRFRAGHVQRLYAGSRELIAAVLVTKNWSERSDATQRSRLKAKGADVEPECSKSSDAKNRSERKRCDAAQRGAGTPPPKSNPTDANHPFAQRPAPSAEPR